MLNFHFARQQVRRTGFEKHLVKSRDSLPDYGRGFFFGVGSRRDGQVMASAYANLGMVRFA
jgi:hypothetical protein